MSPSTTRRGILGAAAVIAAAAVVPASAEAAEVNVRDRSQLGPWVLPPKPGPMMELLAERNKLADWINNEPDWGALREPEREAVHDRLFAMEDRIFSAEPSLDAIRAKLGLLVKLDTEGTACRSDVVIDALNEALRVI